MPRGGRRSGRARAAYGNRTDLQPVKVPPSRSYGEAAAAEEAQRVMPLPQMAGTPVPAAGAGVPAPGPSLPFGRSTDRPREPVTAGMPSGPGPGPGMVVPSVDPVLETLRAIARRFPTPAVFELLEGYQADDSRGR